MMDIPPEPPPSPEQIIERRLEECGLDANGISVKFEDYLQSIEIVIKPNAGATSQQFECIMEAAGSEIVTFEDSQMHGAYLGFVSDLTRPQRLAELEAKLTENGLLTGMPKRQDFHSIESFAEAIERHSGLVSGSTLNVMGDEIVFNPTSADENFADFHERYSDLLMVVYYVSMKEGIGFGIIGNERERE